jgi:hypothetical protein
MTGYSFGLTAPVPSKPLWIRFVGAVGSGLSLKIGFGTKPTAHALSAKDAFPLLNESPALQRANAVENGRQMIVPRDQRSMNVIEYDEIA